MTLIELLQKQIESYSKATQAHRDLMAELVIGSHPTLGLEVEDVLAAAQKSNKIADTLLDELKAISSKAGKPFIDDRHDPIDDGYADAKTIITVIGDPELQAVIDKEAGIETIERTISPTVGEVGPRGLTVGSRSGGLTDAELEFIHELL